MKSATHSYSLPHPLHTELHTLHRGYPPFALMRIAATGTVHLVPATTDVRSPHLRHLLSMLPAYYPLTTEKKEK